MNMYYPNLFSEFNIRGHVYRNRILGAPLMFAHTGLKGSFGENVRRQLEERAKGGFASVSSGEITVNFQEASCKLYADLKIDYKKHEGEYFEMFKDYARRIKANGAIAMAEICHEGAQANTVFPYEPWGPDEYIREDGVHVHAFDEKMMDKVCGDFEDITSFLMAAGFDGIVVHGGHGFLLQQFVSPRTNHRTDKYGGSSENRARFPKHILEAVRTAGGENMILELRFSAMEDIPEGMTVDDSIAFFKQLEGIVDIIHVSNGIKSLGYLSHTFTSAYDIHGYNIGFAAKIKKAVNIPVAVVGGLNDPSHCEEIIESGAADFVILGRQQLADPEFPNKAKAGRKDLIRKCIRCYSCYPGDYIEHKSDDPDFRMGKDRICNCALNPNSDLLFDKSKLAPPEDTISKRILIVGSGPAGLQASLTLKKAGHNVTIAEKLSEPGGMAKIIGNDKYKREIGDFVRTLIAQIKEEKIDLRCGIYVTPDYIKEFSPDILVLATGADGKIPDIEGIENAGYITGIYTGSVSAGKRVVLVGGGLSNCEAAIGLADEGREISIIARSRLAKESARMSRAALFTEMEKRNINFYENTKTLKIEANAVKILTENGEEKIINADTILYAAGVSSNRDMLDGFTKAAGSAQVFEIGDCEGKGGGNIRKATKDAFALALKCQSLKP